LERDRRTFWSHKNKVHVNNKMYKYI